MIPLRQSTAGQKRPLGPFVDETDGFTAETGLTIANTDIRLWKADATAADKNSGGAAHVENGVYWPTFDATDSNTAGPLTVTVSISGARPVRHDFMVYPANVYDSMIVGTDQVTADDIAVANRIEMDSNSTKLTAIDAALDTLPDVLDAVPVDGSITWADAKVVMLAVLGGNATGLTDTTKVFKNQAGTAAVTSVHSGGTRTVTIA